MNQTQIERLIHPKHIEQNIKEEINIYCSKELNQCVSAIRKWIDIKEWESKDKRKEQLRYLDLYEIILSIIAKTVMYAAKPIPLVNIAAMCTIAGMDKLDSVKTVSEILAIIEPSGMFELVKHRGNGITVQSLLEPSENIQNRLKYYCYLPPMIEKPNLLTHNKSCAYKTIKIDSLILRSSENYHDKDICLDVLNIQNKNQYELDISTLNSFQKEWHRKELTPDELAMLDLQEQEHYVQEHQTWQAYQEQFMVLAGHLKDKTFYITNKVDKRGRIYAQAYHFTTQGTSFEKACINLKHKELVYGEL